MVHRRNIRTPKPPEQIKMEPNIAMVKEILVDNIDRHVIYFYDEATRIAKPNEKINIDLLLACMLLACLLSQLK